MTPALLERIVVEHLRDGRVVEEGVFTGDACHNAPWTLAVAAWSCTFTAMPEVILYKRILPHGPAVRIRRTSENGVVPVTAVLEVDRRAGTPREGMGTPPSLMSAEGKTEAEVVAKLQPHASDDRAIVLLIRERGLR